MKGVTKQTRRNNSRITSGRSLLPYGTDMRNVWARRWSDLNRLFAEELGGDTISQAERSLVRRIATIQVALERLEQKFAESETGGCQTDLETYVRLSNTLRRIFVTVGIKRVPKDITPDLQTYLRNRSTGRNGHARNGRTIDHGEA
jgi:hypothetical protein